MCYVRAAGAAPSSASASAVATTPPNLYIGHVHSYETGHAARGNNWRRRSRTSHTRRVRTFSAQRVRVAIPRNSKQYISAVYISAFIFRLMKNMAYVRGGGVYTHKIRADTDLRVSSRQRTNRALCVFGTAPPPLASPKRAS